MRDKLRAMALAAGAVFFLSIQSSATPITSLTAWKATLTGSATELTFPSSSSSYSGNHLSLGLFLFTGPSLTVPVTGAPGPTSSAVTTTMPTGGETAFMFHARGGSLFNLTMSDGESYSGLATGYYGFSSATSITSFTITAVSGTLTLDDFWYGVSSAAGSGNPPTNPTPEAATFLLTCGGLLVLFGSGRKLVYRQATS